MRSHSYLKTICGWIIPVLVYLRYHNNLEKSPPSVLILIDLPILIVSTFRAFNYYPIMGSMNYFGQVVLEILGNNWLKSYFGNLEIEILSMGIFSERLTDTSCQYSSLWFLHFSSYG